MNPNRLKLFTLKNKNFSEKCIFLDNNRSALNMESLCPIMNKIASRLFPCFCYHNIKIVLYSVSFLYLANGNAFGSRELTDELK